VNRAAAKTAETYDSGLQIAAVEIGQGIQQDQAISLCPASFEAVRLLLSDGVWEGNTTRSQIYLLVTYRRLEVVIT
jgi:hypothetical protein